MPQTTFRPPLTAAELRDIGQRRDPTDIIRLLWEIKRLRAIALRAHQYQLTAHGSVGGSILVLNALRRELEGGAVVAEQAPLDDLRERQERPPHVVVIQTASRRDGRIFAELADICGTKRNGLQAA